MARLIWAYSRVVLLVWGSLWAISRLQETRILCTLIVWTFGQVGILPAHPAFAFLVAVIAFVLIGRVYFPAAHIEALRADLQVASILGQDPFLATLTKIDGMGFADIEQ